MVKHQIYPTLILCGVCALLLFSLLGSAQADEFNVTYIAPGYTAIDFVTLPVNTAAIEFDEEGNIYTIDGELGSGVRQVTIWEYPAPDYQVPTPYVSYDIEAKGINGLAFDESGNLFITEFDRSLPGDDVDTGYIRKISNDLSVGAPIGMFYYDSNGDEVDFRPTGVTAIEDCHLFFPGRKWSDPDFGNLYEITNFNLYSPPPDIISAGVVLTALTRDASGNFYGGSRPPDNSIYTHDAITNNLIKVASFDQYVEELSFWQGSLYALEARNSSVDTEASIIQISPGGIDIKPGSFPNCFNQNGHGVITVAVFGSETLDVNEINVETLALQGLSIKVVGKSSKFLSHTEFVNNDEYLDLVAQFDDSDAWMDSGSGYAILQGTLFDGSRIWAGDSICIVPSE